MVPSPTIRNPVQPASERVPRHRGRSISSSAGSLLRREADNASRCRSRSWPRSEQSSRSEPRQDRAEGPAGAPDRREDPLPSRQPSRRTPGPQRSVRCGRGTARNMIADRTARRANTTHRLTRRAYPSHDVLQGRRSRDLHLAADTPGTPRSTPAGDPRAPREQGTPPGVRPHQFFAYGIFSSPPPPPRGLLARARVPSAASGPPTATAGPRGNSGWAGPTGRSVQRGGVSSRAHDRSTGLVDAYVGVRGISTDHRA